MASIGSLGVGSGIDLNSILSQLMEVQRRPLYDVQAQQKTIKSQISDYGTLKSTVSVFQEALDKLKDADAFKTYTASSSDESVFTASADSTAATGSYNVNVTQLAQANKLASMRFADSTTATVGTGTLSVSVGADTMNLTVDATNNTLAGLRDAINGATDNPGITATIINEGGGSRLMLTSNETGLENAMVIANQTTAFGGMFDITNDQDGDDLNDVEGQAQQVSAAQDALFTVDSFSVSSATNSAADVIEGVTFDFASVGTSTLSIGRDDDSLAKLVEGISDAYNTMRGKISSLREGNLRTDSTLRQLDNMFLAEMTQSANLTGLTNLFEAGITRDRYGKLNFDSAVFKEAMATNSTQVAALFTDEAEGFAVRLSSLAESVLDYDGLFKTREEGLNSRLKSLQNSEDRINRSLVDMEARMKKQFSNLDTTMSKLSSTSNYLNSQLMAMMG
jgi:flagellar hook-associated protein 2